jgi:hypothetical protein
MTGSLGHCRGVVDAAPNRRDGYIALDLARGMRQKRTFPRNVADVTAGSSVT